MIADAGELLEGLVRIPSPSGEEATAAAWLVQQMRDLGFTRAVIDEAGNAVGEMGEGPRTIVLLGHIDTVPGQLEVRRHDHVLHGRGSVDAKGPLVAFIMAAAALGVRCGWRLVVAGAVEEEAATSKGARRLRQQESPDYCVIGEPSSWQKLCLGYKGRLLLDYRLSRPVSHTAGQETGACELAVAFWNRVTAYAAERNQGRSRHFDCLSPSLRQITSDSDGLYDTVRARIGLRVPPGLAVNRLQKELAALADGTAELLFSGHEEAFRSDKNNALVRAFLGAIRRQDGKPAFTVKTGTSDMNVVGPVWSCPILAYGPGDSTLDHTPEERLDLRELDRTIAVLRDALQQVTATP